MSDVPKDVVIRDWSLEPSWSFNQGNDFKLF
jgi:hypothetical protein